ncbi:MAG: NUDIX hydrolase [Comamonadaceae bacterium]|nr:NUDIX hydrolase [Comamonadaceae bacterium]
MTNRWKPGATVAAIIEQHGKFLLVEEHTPDGLRLNNPAGHLDEGETLTQACIRETLEETMYRFAPTSLIGIYMSRFIRPNQGEQAAQDITFLRFAFCGTLGLLEPGRTLDKGIVRTLWLTPQEIRDNVGRMRSPMVLRCMEDYLAGQRLPLSVIFTDPSVLLGQQHSGGL